MLLLIRFAEMVNSLVFLKISELGLIVEIPKLNHISKLFQVNLSLVLLFYAE